MKTGLTRACGLLSMLALFPAHSQSVAGTASLVRTEAVLSAPGGTALGEVAKDATCEIVEPAGDWTRIRITGWVRTTAIATEVGSSATVTKTPVELVDYRFESHGTDYSRKSKPYSAHVRAYFQFRNNTKTTVTGVVFECVFVDGFGDVLYKTEFKDHVRVPPDQVNPMDSFWYFEDNEFIGGEPYDKLQSAIAGHAAKARVRILRIAPEDGTVLELAPTAKN